jgi:hypothetical protein
MQLAPTMQLNCLYVKHYCWRFTINVWSTGSTLAYFRLLPKGKRYHPLRSFPPVLPLIPRI